MLILSSFRQIYQFGIAVPTGQDVGFDPYASDPLPCVVLPGAALVVRWSHLVQHCVLLSGTPYGGQSPTLFPGRHICLEPVSNDYRDHVPTVLPVSSQRFVAGRAAFLTCQPQQ